MATGGRGFHGASAQECCFFCLRLRAKPQKETLRTTIQKNILEFLSPKMIPKSTVWDQFFDMPRSDWPLDKTAKGTTSRRAALWSTDEPAQHSATGQEINGVRINPWFSKAKQNWEMMIFIVIPCNT